MDKIIHWKHILSDNYFNGIPHDSMRKEALNRSLIDGDFSCVKKDKKNLINQYMKQEGLTFPSNDKILFHKRKRVKEIIITSTLVLSILVGLSFTYFEIFRTDDAEAIEILELTNRTKIISEYLNAEPTNLLVDDERSMWTNQYNGVSYVTYQGKKFYVEMKKSENEEWEILKMVELK